MTNATVFILQPLTLVLLDITPMMTVLDGVLMELQDCALPLLRGDRKSELVLHKCLGWMS